MERKTNVRDLLIIAIVLMVFSWGSAQIAASGVETDAWYGIWSFLTGIGSFFFWITTAIVWFGIRFD